MLPKYPPATSVNAPLLFNVRMDSEGPGGTRCFRLTRSILVWCIRLCLVFPVLPHSRRRSSSLLQWGREMSLCPLPACCSTAGVTSTRPDISTWILFAIFVPPDFHLQLPFGRLPFGQSIIHQPRSRASSRCIPSRIFGRVTFIWPRAAILFFPINQQARLLLH